MALELNLQNNHISELSSYAEDDELSEAGDLILANHY